MRRFEVPYRDEAAEDADRMEILSREVPKNEEVPDEKTVPPPTELLVDLAPEDGGSYR